MGSVPKEMSIMIKYLYVVHIAGKNVTHLLVNYHYSQELWKEVEVFASV